MKLLSLILEGRREDFLKLYGKKFSNEDLKTILALSQELNPNNKFLLFLGKVLTPNEIDVDKVKKILIDFNKYQNVLSDKDINNYDTLDSVLSAISNHENKLRREVKKVEGADILYEDDRFVVILPLNYKASCYYGSGTKWCVTSSENYFENYDNTGKVFFVIDKKAKSSDRFYKVAVQRKFEGDTVFWDAEDKTFSIGWILDKDAWKKINSVITGYMEENFEEQIKIFQDQFLKKQELERQRREELIRRRGEKLRKARQLREENAYDINKNTPLSNKANAVWEVITSDLDGDFDLNENEDIYYLVPTHGEDSDGPMYFEWLGESNFEAEFIVGNDEQADQIAKDNLKDSIESSGLRDMFQPHYIEYYLDSDKVEEYFREYYEEDISYNTEGYFDDEDKQLSDAQEELINDLEEKLQILNQKLSSVELDMYDIEDEKDTEEYEKMEELRDSIQEEIDETEQEIEDTKESPEGDIPDELVEKKIKELIEDVKTNPMYYIDEFSLDMEDFVNVEDLVDSVITNDGRGHIISSYDGNEYEARVNGEWYFVYRIE